MPVLKISTNANFSFSPAGSSPPLFSLFLQISSTQIPYLFLYNKYRFSLHHSASILYPSKYSSLHPSQLRCCANGLRLKSTSNAYLPKPSPSPSLLSSSHPPPPPAPALLSLRSAASVGCCLGSENRCCPRAFLIPSGGGERPLPARVRLQLEQGLGTRPG